MSIAWTTPAEYTRCDPLAPAQEAEGNHLNPELTAALELDLIDGDEFTVAVSHRLEG